MARRRLRAGPGSRLAKSAPAAAFVLAMSLAGQGEGRDALPPSASTITMTAERCAALVTDAAGGAPVNALVVTAARWHAAGETVEARGIKTAPLPAHCEIEGHYGAYAGGVGGTYRTGFRMRLPESWNARLFFQGGGGSNGVVADGTGYNGPGNPSALERGYATYAQDSGHDNNINIDPEHGGDLAFGHDPAARANYGHASLKPGYDLALHMIQAAYRQNAKTKIFWGCSKGGQEGMAFAQRYPDAFDGIVAMAPGFSLPRAAVAQTWDSQQLASILKAQGIAPTLDSLSRAIAPAQWKLVTDTVLATCDADDGARDGMIGAVGLCTSARVVPALRKQQCADGATGTCLAKAQIDALVAIISGARNRAGKPLYAAFPWDAGVGTPGWSAWKTGIPGGPMARNVLLGAGSLAAVFTSPPTALRTDPQALLDWQLGFDFDRDAAKIYAVVPPFRTSAWQDVGMRSTDLSAFKARGGKLIVPHGMSDPVFSAYDTLSWWGEVNQRNGGKASDFVRVFPVPGMNHCGGGPATDNFDSLGALEAWVIKGRAPQSIPAKAGAATPWPGRERPLCAYPLAATADGKGGFMCRKIAIGHLPPTAG